MTEQKSSNYILICKIIFPLLNPNENPNAGTRLMMMIEKSENDCGGNYFRI